MWYIQSMLPTLTALAEPNRLRIIELLREGPRPVGEIAARLQLRQPQVSKHLRVLSEAGLVAHEAQGTRHLYRLDPEGVAQIRDYLDGVWNKALASFKRRTETQT